MRIPRLFLFLSVLGLFALAADLPAQAADVSCQFGDQLKALSAASDKSDASAKTEDVLVELKLRKSLLRGVLDCSTAETSRLQATTQGLSGNDQNIAAMKKRYESEFEDITNYYNLQKNKVNDLGIQGTKDVARAVGVWRASNYLPLAETIGNLILWSKNQNLFPVADSRLSQIARTLRTLNLDERNDVAALLTKAQTNLISAESLNNQAKAALLQRTTPDPTGNLIKQSLNNLAQTYQNFFDLSELVKKMLPL